MKGARLWYPLDPPMVINEYCNLGSKGSPRKSQFCHYKGKSTQVCVLDFRPMVLIRSHYYQTRKFYTLQSNSTLTGSGQFSRRKPASICTILKAGKQPSYRLFSGKFNLAYFNRRFRLSNLISSKVVLTAIALNCKSLLCRLGRKPCALLNI